MSDSIIFQSIFQNNVQFQQLSNLSLTGLSTMDASMNHDHGKLYGTFTKSGSTYTLNLYKDSTKFDLVATATSTAFGVQTISAANGSGIGGTVNFAQYAANDSAIEAICLLAIDGDLPMSNLTGVSDYDLNVGFAAYHVMAFEYIKEFIKGRAKSLIWNPMFLDTSQINGAVGGYDLSKVLNWTSESINEAAAHYAMYRIAERQYVEPGSTFDVRAKESRNLVKAHLTGLELQFDETGNRVEEKGRSLSTWKISRA